ncbi:MAG TPA: AMP-dependent synthetase/ligase [Jatrophihabitans sp.]|uniref:AMP-dependent synthetase/ligase n=1 Tax=Jatrophihabitans sp. TaxID=1932789 RepID=UPI002E02EA95|nr:AMP-dependent synthetase/ligase [Jatrophihabitans sp.]
MIREIETQACAALAGTAVDDMERNAREHPSQVGFSIRGDGVWEPVTYAGFAAQVEALARGMIAAGIGIGDRVALMSRNRFEWTLCDYALWSIGAVVVPVYETSSAEQTEWILTDSGAVAVIVELQRHQDLVDSVRARCGVVHVWSIENGDLAALVEAGRPTTDDELRERRDAVDPAAVATLVYTSGTTGRPKGCPLTHANLAAQYRNTTAAPGIPDIFNDRSSTLLFLPLAHVLARVIQLSCVSARVHIGYTPDTAQLAQDLLSFRPTLLLAVPRVFEKLYNTAARSAHEAGPVQNAIFTLAERAAVRYSEQIDAGSPSPLLRAEHGLYDRLVYAKIRAALGGRMRWSVSGGAPLGARLGHFFRGSGITVLEGYGLTETSAAGTLNLPASQRVGSVGPPVPGGSIRIAEDGEILLRGDFVFSGYWGVDDPEILDDEGWLHSGDLGQIDAGGFVTVTGRKKELIVTAGGKNVAPTALEDRIRAHWLVSQCLVVGDRRPFIACLITLDATAFAAWRAEHGLTDVTAAEALADERLHHEIQVAVDEANAAVSKAESIRAFTILDGDFTEAAGQLTATLKLKRNVLADQFGTEIEALYAAPRT